MLKLFKPYVSWRSVWYVLKVLRSTQLAEGPLVAQFEHEFCSAMGCDNAVMLNSGTSALELAYDLAGLKAGDEVISPILTCTATNIPLVRRGVKIKFADIDYDLNVNINDVERKITRRTRALVFVHFGGNSRGLEECIELGKRHKIPVIEDAAQAIGNGNFGKADFCAVSLQAIKTITAGDGGILLCKKRADWEKAKRLKWYGYDRPLKQKLGDCDLYEAGYKFHSNEVAAAIALGNLRSIQKILLHKNKLKSIYESYGLFAHAWLAGGFTEKYRELKVELAINEIEMGQHHYRNDRYKIFGSRKFPETSKGKYPIMDELENRYFFIPYHMGVTEKQAHQIGKICDPFLMKM